MLWQVADGTPRLLLETHTAGIADVAVSPDGGLIATTSSDRTVRLWDRMTGRPVRRIDESGMRVAWAAAFSPDRHSLALAHHHCGVTLWDIASGKMRGDLKRAKAPDQAVIAVAFTPDGKLLASLSRDEPVVALWNVATGQHLRDFPRAELGSTMAISPDGRRLVCAGHRLLTVWEISGKLLYALPIEGTTVAFSPCGLLLAIGGGAPTYVLEAETGKDLARFESYLESALAFSPDGRYLVGAQSRRLWLYDLGTGWRTRIPAAREDVEMSWITAVAFTRDGKGLISGCDDGTALIWDVPGFLPAEPAASVENLFEELKDADYLRAYSAFCRLRATRGKTLEGLKKQVRATVPAPRERVERLITSLDSAVFESRERASRDLRELGLSAEPALRRARRNQPPVEAARRIDVLLGHLESDPQWRQSVWVVRLLENLGGPEARDLLQRLVDGDADSRLTQQAAAVLQRLPPREKAKE
jgi:hypothetical protein